MDNENYDSKAGYKRFLKTLPGGRNIHVGRPKTARAQTWNKTEYSHGRADVPDGTVCDVTPAPGRTYTRDTWPPRGRGKGESLLSPRRCAAKLRAVEVIKLRLEGVTWEAIASQLGFADASGAYRAYVRTFARIDWDRKRAKELFLEQIGLTEAEFLALREEIEAEMDADL